MKQSAKRVRLSRETLRTLGDRGTANRPVGTFPDTQLPNNCPTASCRPHIC
jgi:hypothetical protein